MSVQQRTGLGLIAYWDSTGGTSYTQLASVVNIGKTDAKWDSVPAISLLSDVAATFAKAGSYDPGTIDLTLAYDPSLTEYQSLVTSFKQYNATAPKWKIAFPATSDTGSGAANEVFSGHIVGLSREYEKEKFLLCDVKIKLTGAI